MKDFWEGYEPEPSKTAPVQPVAYLCENAVGHKYFRWKKPSSTFKPIALYTTPPAAAVLEGRDWSLLEATQESLREHMAEIKRLKEAQPAVQEPVAWMTQARNFVHVMEFTEAEAKLYGWMPVYTTPPAAQRQSAHSAWVGLTDEEAEELRIEKEFDKWGITESAFKYAVRDIEAKLRSKNI